MICKEIRTIKTDFQLRQKEQDIYIEGYFAVFNAKYDFGNGMSESIARGAFRDSLNDDIRALTNHDTTLVLGRTKAGTLSLHEDAKGLKGKITVNRNDKDATNLYERIKRGDVTQCSIGFDVVEEYTDVDGKGNVHWTIKKAKLYEVSVVTFPAYEETGVEARKKRGKELRRVNSKTWKRNMISRLKKAVK